MKPEKLTDLEIHHLGMNYVGEILQENGYEFLAINSTLKKHPQFVCFKKGMPTLFVLVKTVLFPHNPDLYDQKFMEKFKKHAIKSEASVWYIGVTLSDTENPMQELYKGNPYKISSTGFKTIV